MLLRSRLRRLSRQRGVSLLELAVVLGIAGILIGGIWAAAAAAREAQRVNQTVEQIRQIVENIRARTMMQATIPSTAFNVLTQTMAAADVFPAETWLEPNHDPVTCSVGAGACHFAHPWSNSDSGASAACNGGTYCVGSTNGLLNNMNNNDGTGGFVILLRDLPQGACIALAARLLGIWDDIGISGIGFRTNGNGLMPTDLYPNTPPPVANIAGSCGAADTNSLFIAFRQSA